MKFLPSILMETPADGGSGGSEPPAQNAPVAPQQATPPATPWAESLGRAFPDEAVRGQVDQYLRSEIQPYVTRREQELGEVSGVWDNLWNEDTTIPTYLSLAESIYGPDLAQKVAETFTSYFESQGLTPEQAAEAGAQAASQQAAADSGVPAEEPDFETWLAAQPKQVQDMVLKNVAQEEDQNYQSLMAEYATKDPTIRGNEHLFSRYVVATDGDMDQALGMWQQEMSPIITENPQAFGWQPPAAPDATAQQPQQPDPVLGSASAPGVTNPPQVPQHQDMDEAMHDFWVDMHGKTSDQGRI